MWVLAQNYIFESDHQSDFIEKPTKSTFFQGQTNNFTIFYLEKELIFLETQICCADGTFFIMKNLPFTQLYMICAQFRHFDNVFSVPFIFIMMKERKALHYEEVFDFIKMKFKDIHNRELEPYKLMIDAEMAVLKTLKKFFPYSKITLCRVHILRNMRKKAIEIFGRPFFEGNQDMKNFWSIIKGLFFLPPTCFEILKSFFVSTFREKFINRKNDFDKFLSYLSKNYLNNLENRPEM